jgi:hemerythrin superfamily protein
MDLFKLLRKDHQKIEALFAKLEGLDRQKGSRERKDELFAEIARELDFHMMTEERYFYAGLDQEEEDNQRLATVAARDHQAIRQMLQNFDFMDGPQWRNNFDVLWKSVRNHFEEEEEGIFEEIRETVDEQTLKNFARQISQVKRERLAATG